MTSRQPDRPAKHDRTATVIAGLLVVGVFESLGWLGLLTGSVTLKGRSGDVSSYSGIPAMIVAYSYFFFAALGTVILAKGFEMKRNGFAICVALVLLPPLLLLPVFMND